MAEQLPVVEPGSAGCCHIHSSGRAPAGEEASHWSADRWPKSPLCRASNHRGAVCNNMWPCHSHFTSTLLLLPKQLSFFSEGTITLSMYHVRQL